MTQKAWDRAPGGPGLGGGSLDELTPQEFDRFLALIYEAAGIKIPATKRVMVGNRLRRRLKATGVESFSAYYGLLRSQAGAPEMPKFLDEITTNETYFFRDAHHFAWFGETFLPEVAKAGILRKRPKTLRVWSAAASTGEELYSAGLKYLAQKHAFARWAVTFLGTDISAAALAAARAGVYDDRAVRLVPADDRRRYFDEDPASKRWAIRDEVRALATWKVHNLMRPLRAPPFDCVFIKNVLIYFDAASKQTVVSRLIESLAAGGYLVVGPTEGIYNMLQPLEKVSTWLYRKPAG